jgi:hypothetical protein
MRKPEIAMIVEGNVSENDAGEIWHLLDYRFNIPITLIPLSVFNTANINRYNTIIFPPGTYSGVTEIAKEKLKTWLQNGGVIIGLENSLAWLNANGLGKFDFKKEDVATTVPSPKKEIQINKPYSQINNFRDAQETSGAIFEVQADLTNPLLYGFYKNSIPVFKANNLFMEQSKNTFANPIVYTANPLMSGYISKENYAKIKGASFAGVSSMGRGRVIGFTDKLTLRGFWFGTNKMLMNAIFYGQLINENSAR